MSDYWFTRRLVNGQAGRAVHPLDWRGRATIAGFVGAMVLGGVAFLLIGLLTGKVALGATVFAVCAFTAGFSFIWIGATKTDPRPRP